MTFEGFPGDGNDSISQAEKALRDAGFSEDDIIAIREFRESTPEAKKRFVDLTEEAGQDFRLSGVKPLEILGRGIGDLLENPNDSRDRPPIFFDGDYTDHGLSLEEWVALDDPTKRTLRDPDV